MGRSYDQSDSYYRKKQEYYTTNIGLPWMFETILKILKQVILQKLVLAYKIRNEPGVFFLYVFLFYFFFCLHGKLVLLISGQFYINDIKNWGGR